MFTLVWRRLVAVAGFVLLLLSPLHASCGSATCPIDTLSQERGGAGWVRIGIDFEYLDQDQPRVGKRDASVGEIRGHHDEVYTVNRLHRLTASAGITDRLSVDLFLPYISRAHEHIHHHHGTDITDGWNVSGIGDLTAQVRYAFWIPEQPVFPTVSAILGGKFPTGVHHEANEDGDIAEAAIQPGSGSYDLITGLSTRQEFSVPMIGGQYAVLPLFTSLTYQWNGSGVDNYRLGNTLLINVGTSYPLMPKLGFLTQVNFKVKERDDRGQTGEETEKTGGESVYLSPGVEFRLTESIRAAALIQFPVYQRINQIQLTSNYNVVTSLSWAFRMGRRS